MRKYLWKQKNRSKAGERKGNREMNFENTRNQAEKAKKNGGFSLVELIIVIAIMAVLVGVLTPAYLKYVDSARKSADVQSIDAIISAMEVVAIDPSSNIKTNSYMRAWFDTEGKLNIQGSTKEIEESLKEMIGDYSLKNASWYNGVTIWGKMSDSGKLEFTFTGRMSKEIWEAGSFKSKVAEPTEGN